MFPKCRYEFSTGRQVSQPGAVCRFDETSYSGENKKVVDPLWACGAAGSALPWHGRGHRFDPGQVHQLNLQLRRGERSEAGRHHPCPAPRLLQRIPPPSFAPDKPENSLKLLRSFVPSSYFLVM